LRQKEMKLRRALEENDTLTFSTQSLTKRIALLQQVARGCGDFDNFFWSYRCDR
jgi:hypothetical protein